MVCRNDNGSISSREAMFGGNGSAKIEEVFKKGTDYLGSCRLMAKLMLPPGASVGKHIHNNDEEFILILKGRCSYDDNGTKTVLSEGDASLTRSGEYHEIVNDTDKDVEYLAMVLTY